MQREIYEVYAKIMSAGGNYTTLGGFPKLFDSMSYNNDVDLARKRAYGAYHAVLGEMYAVDTRPLQIAMILRASDGVQEIIERVGELPPVPDPEPEPEPDPESEGEPEEV